MTLYAVNGKEPIAAWIPSLDTAGNGTSTVNDLIGSTNGATNADWVVDTSAGGTRSLQFNGFNDEINFPSAAFSFGASASISMWVKLVNSTPTLNNQTGFMQTRVPVIGKASHYVWTNGLMYSTVFRDSRVDNISLSGSVARDAWHLLTVTTDGTSYKIFQNTVEICNVGAEFTVNFSNSNFLIGKSPGSDNTFFMEGSLDDIRLFDVALDSSDVSYLYNSGNGRGRILSSIKRTKNLLIGSHF